MPASCASQPLGYTCKPELEQRGMTGDALRYNVYCVTCHPKGKHFIDQTIQDIQARLDQHLRSDAPFYKDRHLGMVVYLVAISQPVARPNCSLFAGIDAFSVELLATADDPQEASRLVHSFVAELGCHYGRRAGPDTLQAYVPYKYRAADHLIG